MISDWLLILLIALATYYLTYVVVDSRLLLEPRWRVQEWSEAGWTRRNNVVDESDEWRAPIAYLLSCYWCASFYVGGAVVLIADLALGVPAPVLVWFAVAGATGLTAHVTK